MAINFSHPLKSGIWTMEFWGLVATLASSIITLFVLFGVVQPQNEESLTKAISAVVAALGALVVQWGGYAGFNNGRVNLKRDAIKNTDAFKIMTLAEIKEAEPKVEQKVRNNNIAMLIEYLKQLDKESK